MSRLFAKLDVRIKESVCEEERLAMRGILEAGPRLRLVSARLESYLTRTGGYNGLAYD